MQEVKVEMMVQLLKKLIKGVTEMPSWCHLLRSFILAAYRFSSFIGFW